MSDYERALTMFHERLLKISDRGLLLTGTVLHPRNGLLIVGGPRNRKAHIPAQTRAGIFAAMQSGQRAERAVLGLNRSR